MKRTALAIAICAALPTEVASGDLFVSACAAELEVKPGSSEVQLMPAGYFKARDGRPGNMDEVNTDTWYIDAEIAARVIALAETRKTPFVIDYEHQTLTAKQTGNPAPAAAWFTKLEWREGDGLYAVDVAWTEKATAYLADKEYRFISPVFSFTKTGEVVELLMAAITNFPAVDGMDEILAAASTFFTHSKKTEEPEMDLVKLRKQLGLAEDADEAKIEAALSALMEAKTTAETQVAALTSKLEEAGNPDPEKYVPVAVVESLKTEVAALTTRIHNDEVADLVSQGIADKKLLKAQEPWALELGKSNIASLRTYLDNAQPIAALSGSQTHGKEPEGKATEADETLVAVCSQMGLDPKDIEQEA